MTSRPFPGTPAFPRPAAPASGLLRDLLGAVSWPAWRAQPWRNLTALLSVMLGVALAFSVHLINASALGEFSAAVRSVNGQADLVLRPVWRGAGGGFDEALYARVAAHPQVALASPAVEADSDALAADGRRRVPLRVLGLDALVAGAIDPALLPQLFPRGDRLAALDPDAVFLNAAARKALGVAEPGTSGAAAAPNSTASGAGGGPAGDPGEGNRPVEVAPQSPTTAATTDGSNAASGTRNSARSSPKTATTAVSASASAAVTLPGRGAPAVDAPVASPRAASAPPLLRLRTGTGTVALRVAGRVAAGGPPLAVMDIAGAQAHFGVLGRINRIEVRLVPGADRDRVLRELALPDGVQAAAPEAAAERVSNVSRAYRVNLTVLALVALFTGAFLVFSVLSLSVAQRLPQFALLGVLGLSARERRALVVAESALLGLAGSALGLALGTALAALALRLLAGDLGGGFFPGVAPTLRFDPIAAAVYGALGIAAAVVGGWLPARAAERIAPAQALKGLGGTLLAGHGSHLQAWAGPALLVLGAGLALLPPWQGLPIGAYLSVAALLVGGIACVPAAVGAVLAMVPQPRQALALLAVERARRQRDSATIAVAGVVASLALAVALTVMVTSFRDAVADWLDTLLPADLYVRAGTAGGGTAGDNAFLDPAFVQAVARLPGVARVDGQRVTQVQLDADAARAPVAVIARPIGDAARALPLVGALADAPAGATEVVQQHFEAQQPESDTPAGTTAGVPSPSRSSPVPGTPAGMTAVYASEAMVALYGAAAGTRLTLPLPGGGKAELFVRGVWRDYARQQGALLLEAADWQRLTGDRRINDLAVRLSPGGGADTADRVRQVIAALAGDVPVDVSSTAEIRRTSLRIFDRSFAVTYWLQAVAIGIGLVGVAASFSAQVLARRKELGLLAHLGLTRRQIVGVVAAEGAVWTVCGALLGLALGVAVSVVLVEVVNPQSFHWTMDLKLPPLRLAALAAAVIAAGTLTAWWAAHTVAGRDVALAVREEG